MQGHWKVKSKDDGPYAIKTVLGWVFNGLINANNCGTEINLSVTVRISVVKLDELLTQQFNHDFQDRKYIEKAAIILGYLRFLQIMSNAAKHQNGHYQLALPFKEDNVIMPNNHPLAEQDNENNYSAEAINTVKTNLYVVHCRLTVDK